MLTKIAASTVRVRISGGTADTTVFAGAGLTVTGYGTALPAGYARFRLVPSGTGLLVQGQQASIWKTLKRGLAASAFFSSPAGWVQLLRAGGSSTRYRGTLGAVRSGSGEITVNRVSLDAYTQGVVPREMPASWAIVAVRAQAIAARSYAKSEINAAGNSGAYDICDTTNCQVYGGMAHYDGAGNLLWTDDPAAIVGNQNTILTYQGAVVFAQFSASNGGATVYGGKPYLVGKVDPYDVAASGDPYLSQAKTVQVSSIAKHFGLRAVSSVRVTKRDGIGPWGGRVVTAIVDGTTTTGAAAHITTDGFGLGSAVGLGTDYLLLQAPPVTTPSVPRAVHATAGDAVAKLSWAAPASTGGFAVTGYQVRWSGHAVSLPASARSTWVGPLSNIANNSVTIAAVNAHGTGAAASVAIRAAAAPTKLVPVAATRLFDTTTTVVDLTHPVRFAVPGHGGVPAGGARSVQLAVNISKPTASGVLTVAASGVDAKPLAALAYRAGIDASGTVSAPLSPSGTLVFRPSAGRVRILAAVESYGTAAGSLLTAGPRRAIATVADVRTGAGVAVSLAGLPGITASSAGVLVAVDATTTRPTSLRLWPDGAATPQVSHLAVAPNAAGSTAVFLPLPASRRIRVAAGVDGVRAQLTLLGVLGSTGGRFETFPASPLVDDASTRPSVSVATTPTSVLMLGRAQLPTTGVGAVLLNITVRGAGAAGRLWAYPASAPHAGTTPSVRYSATGSTTATTLIRVAGSGGLALKSSTAGVRVSVDVIGYVSSG